VDEYNPFCRVGGRRHVVMRFSLAAAPRRHVGGTDDRWRLDGDDGIGAQFQLKGVGNCRQPAIES
jgi:hypothetical protein